MKTPEFKPSDGSAKRADEIRRRRTSRSQQRVTTATSRISNPVHTRPVISRGGGFGTPIHRQASTNPRRQFYVAMDNAGSELRLPAIPVIHPGWRLLSGIIVIIVSIGLYSLLNSPFFQVYTVDVQGLQRINAGDLTAVLDLENRSIIEINPHEIDEAIALSFPELADVHVSVSLPNAVSVSARERQPTMAWQMSDTVRWIDVEGYIFPARGEAGPLVTIFTDDEIPMAPLTGDELAAAEAKEAEIEEQTSTEVSKSREAILAEVSGEIPVTSSQRADMSLLNASLQLTQKLPEGTAIVYDRANGLGWSDTLAAQVYIGKDLENFEVKYALYQAIVGQLNDEGKRPALISVKHLNAPFYRLEQ
jgi:cell division protein FtsQ